MAKYVFLRFFLTKSEMPPILNAAGEKFDNLTRKDHLYNSLTKDMCFTLNDRVFSYIHIGVEGNYILSRIGHLKNETVNKGPETGFAETEQEFWHAANFIIDISGHSDGQKVAIEEVGEVGSPLQIIREFADQINKKSLDSGWEIVVNPLIERKEFWAVVECYKGKITELELTFVAPNVLGGMQKTREILRELKDQNNMQTASISLHNKNGKLNPDSKGVRESIDYITEGGGKTVMKAGREKIFDSDMQQISKIVDKETDIPITKETKPRWKSLIEKIFS